jgi:hypothetical protein
MTYASPAWELTTDAYLLKLQHLQNKAVRTVGNFSKYTQTRDLHMAFNHPHVYDYLTKL